MAGTPVVIGEAGGLSIVVGLTWRRMLAGRTTLKEAQRIAKADKSTHYICRIEIDGSVRSIGHGRLAAKSKSKRGYMSLAHALQSRLHEQDRALYAMTMPDGGAVWLCVVSDGMVLDGTDLLTDESTAREWIATVSAEPSAIALQIFSDRPGLFEGARDLSWDSIRALVADHASESLLRPLSDAESGRQKAMLLVTALALVVVGGYGYSWWRERQDRLAAELEEGNQPIEIPPAQRWVQAVRAWEKDQRISVPGDLTSVLKHMASLPLDLGGWELSGGDCLRSGGQWTCSARFDRRKEVRATTANFLEALPQSWTASWGQNDKAAAFSSFPALSAPLVVDNLGQSQQVSLPVLTLFQHDAAAFTSTVIGNAAAAPIDPPKGADGKPLAVDPATAKPYPLVMPISLSGPLRSVALVEHLPISWDSIKFEISREFAASGAANQAFIVVSEMKGNLYAVR